MKQTIVYNDKTGEPYKTRKAAINNAPWASKIIKVDTGYMAFESLDDFYIWKNQR